MTIGLIGKKCGMSRVFTADGVSVPVTVVKVDSNRVSQVKNAEKDGYAAIQVASGKKSARKVSKAMAGHYTKANMEAGSKLMEFRLSAGEGADLKVGSMLDVDFFKVGDIVNVRGVTRGKGFAGVIKRYHFSSQDETHGNSLTTRAPGSIGQRQTPGRVFKGKRMAGHLGNANCTIRNLEIVKVDKEKSLLLIKGGIPGAPNSDVIIKPAAKKNRGNKDGD